MTECVREGCHEPIHARSLCVNHYPLLRWQTRLGERVTAASRCDAMGCRERKRSRGLCTSHYGKLMRGASVNRKSENVAHGTLGGYTNCDCRCDACREAMSRYNRVRAGGTLPAAPAPRYSVARSTNNRTGEQHATENHS